VGNSPPEASAGKDMKVAVNTAVTFSGKGKDPDNKIVKEEWDFQNDGTFDWNNQSGTGAVFTYTSKGVYTARFRVTADDGKTAEKTITVTVSNKPPTANAGEDIVSKKGRTVTLNGKGTDEDDTVVLYEWDFNADGAFDWNSKETGIVKHKFEEYCCAVLRVTDSDGGTGSDTLLIIICPEGMETIIEKKYCIDTYEWPNGKSKSPEVNISWKDADKKCREAGKRLCTGEEWTFACQSGKENNFPYGQTFDKDACNTSDQIWVKGKGAIPSGKFPRCKTQQDVYDMSGNVMEWTSDGTNEKRLAAGGSYLNKASDADCTAKASEDPNKQYFFVGFRCCK
jgi:hypothetical protein